MYPKNSNNEHNFKEYQKHKSHEKHRQNNSKKNNNILRSQQDTNEHNGIAINETESYHKNPVRKNKINLKNDMHKIKETVKNLLTKQ